jgi:hypothetical protein
MKYIVAPRPGLRIIVGAWRLERKQGGETD